MKQYEDAKLSSELPADLRNAAGIYGTMTGTTFLPVRPDGAFRRRLRFARPLAAARKKQRARAT